MNSLVLSWTDLILDIFRLEDKRGMDQDWVDTGLVLGWYWVSTGLVYYERWI